MTLVKESDLRALLQSASAVAQPKVSTPRAHVYFSNSRKQYVLVYRSKDRPGMFHVEYHSTCPCNGVMAQRGLA